MEITMSQEIQMILVNLFVGFIMRPMAVALIYGVFDMLLTGKKKPDITKSAVEFCKPKLWIGILGIAYYYFAGSPLAYSTIIGIFAWDFFPTISKYAPELVKPIFKKKDKKVEEVVVVKEVKKEVVDTSEQEEYIRECNANELRMMLLQIQKPNIYGDSK
jgi:hypothetical protein